MRLESKASSPTWAKRRYCVQASVKDGLEELLIQVCESLCHEFRVQGVNELDLRMGHARGVEGFVSNMQHAQVLKPCNDKEGLDLWPVC